MRKIIKFFFAVSILLLIHNNVFARTYYLKPAANGGSDTNDGLSPATAFATVGHFAQIAVSGDIGNIADGTYNENNITFKNSGVTVIGEGLPAIEGSDTIFNIDKPNISLSGLNIISHTTKTISVGNSNTNIIPVILLSGGNTTLTNNKISELGFGGYKGTNPEQGGFTPGIYILNSSSNTIENSAIATQNVNSAGIYLSGSTKNIIRQNKIDARHSWSVRIVDSDNPVNYDHIIDTTNTGYNNLPIYYFYNKNNLILDGVPADEIFVAYSNNLTIKNITLNNSEGIYFVQVNSSTVMNYINIREQLTTAEGIAYTMVKDTAISPIYLYKSNYVTIADVNVNLGGRHNYGIKLISSNYNSIGRMNYTTSYKMGGQGSITPGVDGHNDFIDMYGSDYNNFSDLKGVHATWSDYVFYFRTSQWNTFRNIKIRGSSSENSPSIKYCNDTYWYNLDFKTTAFNTVALINPVSSKDGHSVGTDYVYDSILSGGQYDAIVEGRAYLVNTICDDSKLKITGTLYRQWWVDVLVIDSSNNPLEGAILTFADKNARQIFSAATAANGRVKKQILTEYEQNASSLTYHTPYTITANYNGKTATLSGVNPDKNWYRPDPEVPLKTVILNIDTGGGYIEGVSTGSIAGVVRDAAGNNPLSGVTVSVGGISTQTDVNGNYLLANIVTSSQSVKAAKSGYLTQTKSVIIVENTTVTLDFVLEITTSPVPQIISYTPTNLNPLQDEGTANTFSVTVDQPVTNGWSLDGVQQSETSQNFTKTWSYSDAGAHTISYSGTNTNGSVSQTWTVTVNDVVQDSSQTDNQKIKVYPNPYIKGKSSAEKINFANLPREVTIRIYTPAGKLVQEIEHRGIVDGGLEEWNVSDVKSGVYLYVISSPGGTRKGKISIIK